MNGIHHITIEGNKYGIRFNNFANTELFNFFKREDEYSITHKQLTERIIEKHKENESILLKIIVYAGIVGNSLLKHDAPELTKEQVAEYIAEANPDELIKIWKVFLDSQGFSLEHESSDKVVEEEKKKKD